MLRAIDTSGVVACWGAPRPGAEQMSALQRRTRSTASARAEIVSTGRRKSAALESEARFAEVLALIEAARRRVYQAVNTELVDLYWQLGAYLSQKIESAEWGDGVVDELAATLARRYPGMRGYTRRNLFRMRQFFEAYRGQKKVSPLVTQLRGTHHLIILSQTRRAEEREFYLLAAIKDRWTKRELERQIQSAASLRNALAAKKVSPAVAQIHPTAIDELKNAYSLEFLSIQDGHSEADLHSALCYATSVASSPSSAATSASWALSIRSRSATRTSRSTSSSSTARFSASSPSS
jgi:predicted nuclease of restriction endonuclease-like (RecB) superfamily